MANHRSPEEKVILKLIESAPFEEEQKKAWTEQIQADGLTVELLDSIHQKLNEIPKEKFAGDWQHGRLNMDLTNSIKRWRLSEASRNFKRNR